VTEKLPQRNGKRHIHGILKHFQVLQLRTAQEQVSARIYRFAYHLSELLIAMLCGSNDTGGGRRIRRV
jgi:hypothetical protein